MLENVRRELKSMTERSKMGMLCAPLPSITLIRLLLNLFITIRQSTHAYYIRHLS